MGNYGEEIAVTTAQDIIGQVEKASKNEFNDVVRAIFEDRTARVVTGRTARPLGARSNGVGTLALIKVEGVATVRGARREWSSVLKVMSLSAAGVEGTAHVGSVSREVEAYRRGVFHDHLSGFRSARAYLISDRSTDIVWLWTEDMSGFDGMPWSREQYLQSAEVLGRLKGHLIRQPVEDHAWMNHGSSLDRWTSQAMYEFFDELDTKRDSDYVRRALPGDSYDRALQFRDDLSRLTAAIRGIPRTVAHGDCHVRNLFTSPGKIGDEAGRFELMAIDLASVGIEPIGSDIGTLLGSSLSWGDDEADTVMRAEAAFFEAFMNKFDSGAAEISRDQIRLSYLTSDCGYGLAVASIPSIVDSQVGPWKGVLERYGGEGVKDDLPDSYRVRIEFITTLFNEAVGLVDQSSGHK